jgi:predicted enzyme related to lactoylglutathione lyase
MFRLMEVLLHTPDMGRMRAFYERALGLRYDSAGPHWTSYRTRGALLALRALTPDQLPHAELTLATEDLEAAIDALRERGARGLGEIETHGWGRLVRLVDPEGNALAVAQPHRSVTVGDGLMLGSAVIHARDLAAVKSFYHHVLGLKVKVDSPWWVEFEAGEASIALRPRVAAGEPHQGRGLSFGFRMHDLMDWAEEARTRGLHFSTAPRDEDWGIFADANDPDGNEVRFYEPDGEPALEEELAVAFEDDDVPHLASIRKPVKKASKAASRVALKPAYKSKQKAGRRRPSATTRTVVSVRGAGPDHARLRPKRTADEKKARTKPAIGRLKKAEIRTSSSQRTAAARASKSRPVKRASANSSRRRAKGSSRRGGGR